MDEENEVCISERKNDMENQNKSANPEAGRKRIIIIPVVFLVLLLAGVTIAILVFNKGFGGNKKRIAQLMAIEGVVDVQKIKRGYSPFSEKYMVIFEQPLDWSDPSKGTFPQRVEVAFRKNARITVIETQGYCFYDKFREDFFSIEPGPEMADYFDGNYVNVEHRFFGDSKPADLSSKDTKYWEYHTAENAANDYHKIYTSLKPILGDKWVSVGTSRGGLMTNVYGFYYPDDMLVYIPYVAPCADGMNDERFYDRIYLELGNEAYGEEQGKSMRDLVTAFQVEALRYKEDVLPKYKEKISGSQYEFESRLTPEVLYDVNVLEFAANFWQYGGDFEKLGAIVAMPDSTEEEREAKCNAVYEFLVNTQDPEDWSQSSWAWPYYVNTATTYGQHHYNFSYLREALEKEGLSDTLSVTEEMEPNLLPLLVFTEEQQEAFQYDRSFHDALVSSFDTTTAKHLMIFGGTDPWTGLAIPVGESENTRIFVNPTKPHDAAIKNMPDDMQKEILNLLKEWLGEDYNESI